MNRGIAILLSGSGRTLENLFENIQAGHLHASVEIVISSNPAAYGLERARRHNVRAEVVAPAPGEPVVTYSNRIFDLIDSLPCNLVVLAGFMRILEIPDRYLGRVMNIHPALLPAFGGRGMFGHNVHQAVIDSGARASGCTVHYVTNDVDAGPIVEQRVIGVRDDDDADALAQRVFEQEKLAYPRSIQLHLDGKLQIHGRRVLRLP
ncbi:MAG: phosphoribosylglycinamide formyltransferase [Planctomycetes bacterium]|nr:phosphoribosylglycinamide formyltransferase [Planctomycetota bacterium]